MFDVIKRFALRTVTASGLARGPLYIPWSSPSTVIDHVLENEGRLIAPG
jgi:hypothetical protein